MRGGSGHQYAHAWHLARSANRLLHARRQRTCGHRAREKGDELALHLIELHPSSQPDCKDIMRRRRQSFPALGERRHRGLARRLVAVGPHLRRRRSEIKHDGFRVIARKDGALPADRRALARLRSRSCILDGNGIPCFDRCPVVRRAGAADGIGLTRIVSSAMRKRPQRDVIIAARTAPQEIACNHEKW
jgi:hypothetical protein